MKIKNMKNEITWIPAVDEPVENVTNHGWLNIDGELLEITNWHSFDDFGSTLETLTLENGKEVYSHDEGETFVLDIN